MKEFIITEVKKVKVELFKEQHLEELLELYNQLLPDEKIVTDEKVLDVLKKIEAYKDYYILVGLIDGRVVTTCSLIIIPNITHVQKPYAIIENVVTHRAYQKNGYAEDVLKYAVNLAIDAKCHKIMLQTRRKDVHVHSLYKKLGFSENITTGYLLVLDKEVS